MKTQKLLNKIDLLHDKAVDRAWQIELKKRGKISFDLSAPSYRSQGIYFEVIDQFDSTYIDSLFLDTDLLDMSDDEFIQYLKNN